MQQQDPVQETEVPEAPALEATPAEEPAAAPEEQIEIGERTFSTQAEALTYARAELQRKEAEAAIAEAYRAGITDHAAATAPAAPQEDEAQKAMRALGITEEEFYSDVPKALLKLSQKIREDVSREVLGTVSTQTEDQKLWSEFNQKNPDLVGFEEDVKVTLAKFDKEIKGIATTKGKEKAMEFLAQKTRSKFQEYIDRAKPRRDLSNAPTNGAPASQSNVTSKIVVEQPLSFTEQIRQNRAKRMS